MIAWGLVMTLMCLVDSFRSLVMCVELTHMMKTNTLTMLWQSPIVPGLDGGRFIPWSDLLHLSLVSTI